MKKILAIAAIVLAAVSCQKGKAVKEIEDDGTPVPIQFGTNLAVSSSTKAVGIGPLDAWNKEKLYIYGLRRTNKAGEPLAHDLVNRQIDRVEAVAPVTADGQPATGKIDVFNRAAAADEPFYYDASTRYDFFAYYVDGAVLDPNPTEADKTPAAAVKESTITYTVTIDGTQDIMLGRAFPEKDIASAVIPAGKTAPSAFQTYSAVAARRKVHPDIVFFHKLSRLTFSAKTGFEDDDDRANKITITGLKVVSKNQAEMDVVAADTTKKETKDFRPAAGTETDLILNVHDAYNKLVPLTKSNGIIPTASPKELGDILVMPGENSYAVTLYLHQEGYTMQDEFPIELTIPFADGAVSQPGYQYDVELIIWGLESIQVKVTMNPWKKGNEGNPFILDPDSDEEKS